MQNATNRNLGADERRSHANHLFHSLRGKLVMAQACAIAYEKLKDTEPSNASDINLIGEEVFGLFYGLYK